MSERDATGSPQITVDVVIPVLNEAHVLEKSVATVRHYLGAHLPYEWRILIVDNGSIDGTDAVAARLSERYPDVVFLSLVQKGRGRALRHAWMQSKAHIVCYMDVDLSTELAAVPKLLQAISEEGYDIAVGSRLMKGAQTKRSLKREAISRSYNLFVKAILCTRFTDAQCGFKAVSRAAVDQLVPQIQDQSWFFDTELLALAEKQGFRIKDVPVVWVEDDDSRVQLLPTAWADIKGVLRLRWHFWRGRFAKTPLPWAGREKT